MQHKKHKGLATRTLMGGAKKENTRVESLWCIFNLLSCLLLSITLCSCGRKQKNIFSFENQEFHRVNKLTLPSVHGVTAKKTPQGNLITWFALQLPTSSSNPATKYLCSQYFTGYNVYRLVRTNIIPKQPCNKRPLKNTNFLDSKKVKINKPIYYLVRAVFTYNNAIVESPTSHIVCLRFG